MQSQFRLWSSSHGTTILKDGGVMWYKCACFMLGFISPTSSQRWMVYFMMSINYACVESGLFPQSDKMSIGRHDSLVRHDRSHRPYQHKKRYIVIDIACRKKQNITEKRKQSSSLGSKNIIYYKSTKSWTKKVEEAWSAICIACCHTIFVVSSKNFFTRIMRKHFKTKKDSTSVGWYSGESKYQLCTSKFTVTPRHWSWQTKMRKQRKNEAKHSNLSTSISFVSQRRKIYTPRRSMMLSRRWHVNFSIFLLLC